MNVTLGASKRADIPALKALWKRSFGDEDCWIDLFFDQAYAPAGLFALREDDKIAAMAAWFPGTLCDCGRGWPAAYLYAVATDEACRGRGYCRRLLDFMAGALAGAGIACLCLRPGSVDLFGFYEKLGFAPFFTCRELTLDAPAHAQGAAVEATAPEYLAAREVLLESRTYLSCPVPVLEYQKQAARMAGGDLYLLQDGARLGCAVAVKTHDGAQLQELLWPGDPQEAAGMVCARMGASRATVRVPGEESPFGMLRWLQAPPALSLGYLGIALE